MEPEELEETLSNINLLLKTTKFKHTSQDFRLIKLLIAACIALFFLAIFLGIFINFALAIVFSILLIGLILFILLRKSNAFST